MPPTPPPVAFSLSAPLAQVARTTFQKPVATLGPVVVLLLPLLPLAAGAQYILNNGGSGALQGVLAGAPGERAGALILRPDVDGWLRLAALAVLMTVIVAVIASAGLTTGALGRRRDGRPAEERRSPLSNIGRTLAIWPAMLVAMTVQLLLVGIGGAVVIVAAAYAGHLRFQFTSVIEVFGLGTLLIWVIRGSLWPATALLEDLTPLGALRRSWEISHGSVMRLLGSALYVVLVIGVPALVVRWILKLALTVLANHEVIGLSPLAIDLWALLPVPIAIFLITALWGREAPVLHDAMIEEQRRVLAENSLDTA